MQDEYGRPLFGMGTRPPCFFRRRTERGGFAEVRATPWAMPRLLHRSEKFEIHEVENQTFRHGLACADCVAKSNSLVGRHFDRPFAAGLRSASPTPLPGTSRSNGPRGSTATLASRTENPAPAQVQSIEMSNCSGEIRESRNCILFGNKARNRR